MEAGFAWSDAVDEDEDEVIGSRVDVIGGVYISGQFDPSSRNWETLFSSSEVGGIACNEQVSPFNRLLG